MERFVLPCVPVLERLWGSASFPTIPCENELFALALMEFWLLCLMGLHIKGTMWARQIPLFMKLSCRFETQLLVQEFSMYMRDVYNVRD